MYLSHMVLGFYFIGARVILRLKTKPDWQRGLLNGVGGKVRDLPQGPLITDPRENAYQAMVREFREETGVETNAQDWRHFATMSTNLHPAQTTSWVVDCFTIKAGVLPPYNPEITISVPYGGSLEQEIVDKALAENTELNVIIHLADLPQYKIVENLQWLIWLARDENPRLKPVRIFYQSDRT